MLGMMMILLIVSGVSQDCVQLGGIRLSFKLPLKLKISPHVQPFKLVWGLQILAMCSSIV